MLNSSTREIRPEMENKNLSKSPKMMEKSTKKTEKKPVEVDELTDEEREAVTIVFHQYETGLREGTILVKVRRGNQRQDDKR